MNQEVQTWNISFDEIKSLLFEDPEEIKSYFQYWALEKGFELSKSTGTKSYALYLNCSRSGKPRKFAQAEGKRSKPSKKIGKKKNFNNSYILGCLFCIAFLYDANKAVYQFNEEKSCSTHNHPEDNKVKVKVYNKEISKFIEETVIEKNNKPADIQEKLNIKFPNLNIQYSASANRLYKVKQQVFGNAGQDANNLLELCFEIKKQFPDFYYTVKSLNFHTC